MSDTPARLLSLLSLLQSPQEWPGSELAERLHVSPRTVRRDVERLRVLGYPVQASMGTTGGYRLVAGSAMPPLLLDDDEAIAIAVGLRTAAGHAVEGIEDAAVRALGKLEQVLPARLRRRVAVFSAATVPLAAVGPRVDPDTLTVLAASAATGDRLRFEYRARDGTTTSRLVEPYRLVPHARRWYLLAHDTDRDDWRTFRVDRISRPGPTGQRFTPRPLPDPDVAVYLTRTLHELAPTYRATATLNLSIDQAVTGFGEVPGDLEPLSEGRCRLQTHKDTLEWLAFRLVQLGCEFEVHEPPELIEYLRGLGDRIDRAVGSAEPVV